MEIGRHNINNTNYMATLRTTNLPRAEINPDSFAQKKGIPVNFEVHAVNGHALALPLAHGPYSIVV